MSTEGQPIAPTEPLPLGTTIKSEDPPRTGDPTDPGPATTDWAKLMGTQAQRYQFIRKLGAGGMGVVYLAHDKKLERKVAIKALRGAASDKMYRRLLREAQALAKLSHPNVVQVFDVDVIDDELRVSMQYIEGRTLRGWLDAEPRDLQAILEVFVEAGEGLAAAHKANLTHRDFKPDNVLIDVEGQVRVADFGLARASDEHELDPAAADPPDRPGASHHDLTQTGAFVGTPIYMAPELFDEHDKRGSTRSDQYAFCVSLYEALHGEPPFQGSNFWTLAAAITEGEITRPDPANARVAKIPRSVERAIRRGMSRDPSERFATMAELNRVLARAAKAAGRRPTRLIGAGVGVAATLAVGGTLGWGWIEARAYERECLEPARALYATGTRQGLVNAREAMARCEVELDDHGDAAVELLRIDEALLYGAGDQPPPQVIPPGSLAGADALVASVGAELWQIGADAEALSPADYAKLWAEARERAPAWIETLALAAAKDSRFAVAPDNHLWLTALIVALAPESGVELGSLDARLDEAIEATRDRTSGRPRLLLIHFRAELEPDHRRAAAVLGRYLDEGWADHEGSKELLELILAERGYRLALAALAEGDAGLRREAANALSPAGQPLQIQSPRFDLARVALALANGDEPASVRADLDRAIGSAATLWWDPRFIEALGAIEAAVVRAEQDAALEDDERELLGAFGSGTLAAADAIAEARALQDRGADDWRLALLIAEALAGTARADPSPTNLEAARREYEAFLARPGDAPDTVLDQAREALAQLAEPATEEPEQPSSKPSPKKIPRVEVTFHKGDYNTAVFEVQGLGGSFQAAPNVGKSLAARPTRMRCQALHASAWTEWSTITPRPGATIRCTKQGVKIGR